MPSQAQIEFFARWNEAARRNDRATGLAQSMSQRIEEAASLSALASEFTNRPDADTPDVRSA